MAPILVYKTKGYLQSTNSVPNKVLLQDWTTAISTLPIDGEDATFVDHFNYFDNCLTKNGNIAAKATTCISKTRATYARLKQLWPRSDIFGKVLLHCVTVLLVVILLENMEYVC